MDPEFVPFSALGRLDLPLKNTVSLPNTIDTNEVGLAMPTLLRLQKLGGFSATHLISTQTPEHNGRGSILDPYSDTPVLRTSHGKTTNGIHIHVDTVERAADFQHQIDQQMNVNQPLEVRFAQELSRACSHAFRQAAALHLLKRSHPNLYAAIEQGETVDSKLLMAFGASIVTPAITEALSLPSMLPAAICASLLYASVATPAAKQYKRETGHDKSLLHEKRWSIVPALRQPDRYLGLTALSFVTPLIKSRK